MSIKIVFMGSPDFALPSLKTLVENFEVVGVITKIDQRSGRGQTTSSPPVKKMAFSLGLNILQPRSLKSSSFFEKLQLLNPDLIVVAAYGKILPKSILDLPKFGCINVHASLLPRWRGAAPINAVILHGDDKSGITIMKMSEGLDTGGILTQNSITLDSTETAGSLFSKLSEMGAKLLVETIPGYIDGKIKPKIQNDDLSTYAPMLKKEDGLIDPYNSAELISRKVRAFHPWPGTFMMFNDKTLKIHSVSIESGQSHKTGTRLIKSKKPIIQTSDGFLILEKVQMAGKKAMSGEEFLRGSRNWESD